MRLSPLVTAALVLLSPLVTAALVAPWHLGRPCASIARSSPLTSSLHFADTILATAPCLADAVSHVATDTVSLAELEGHFQRLHEVLPYLRPSAHEAVRLALEVAFCAHHGQSRRSGEPYITHPVEVAIILGESQLEKATILAGLLHDTVEDTPLTFAELESLFGHTVRKIVEGETKVSKLPKLARRAQLHEAADGVYTFEPISTKVEEQVENLRSMFIAMADDWRIVVVKLADRLHNMRTLQHMPVHKRASISRETLEIFSPLAHRLGFWGFKTELADLSFKYLFPTECEPHSPTHLSLSRRADPSRAARTPSAPHAECAFPMQVRAARLDDLLSLRFVRAHPRGRQGADQRALAGRPLLAGPATLRLCHGPHQVHLFDLQEDATAPVRH